MVMSPQALLEGFFYCLSLERMKKIHYFVFIFSSFAFAQKDSLAVITLKEVEVKSVQLNTALERFPAALHKKVIALDYVGPQQSLQEYVESLPGLVSFNRSNYAQDLRLSIRGFGSRAAFGIRGIKLIVDGIPETTPDGQGQLDNLPLALLSSIEIIRGPNSLRFGNASGGVLYMNTLETIEKNFNSIALQQGSYGQHQLQWTGGVIDEKSTIIYHAIHSNGEGYRDHSSFSSSLFNLKLKRQLNPFTSIVVQLNATNSPKANDAGGQTLDEYNTSRRNARERNMQFDAGEKITHVKSGVSINYKKEKEQFHYYMFVADRDFEGRLPFSNGGWISLNRTYSGLGSNYSRKWEKNVLEFTSQIGFAIGRQRDYRVRYVNNNGIQGEKTLNQNESFENFGSYFIQHINYFNWTLNAGIRWDNNTLRVDDYYTSNGNNSAEKNLNAWSPQMGISYRFSPKVTVFLNHSKSYETPSLSELSADPSGQGGFNDLIDIQQAVNREIGLNFSRNATRLSFVYFDIFTQNDLVPYRIEDFPGRTFYRNAGSTSRKGWEFNVSHQFNTKWSANLTWNNGQFRYTDYERDGSRYDGNQLPGIPDKFGQWSITYQPKEKWTLRYIRTFRGDVFAEDSNQTMLNAFWRDDLNLGFPFKLNKYEFIFQLGANNLFNKRYSDNIRINAFGGRFYEAAPEREFFFRLDYNF